MYKTITIEYGELEKLNNTIERLKAQELVQKKEINRLNEKISHLKYETDKVLIIEKTENNVDYDYKCDEKNVIKILVCENIKLKNSTNKKNVVNMRLVGKKNKTITQMNLKICACEEKLTDSEMKNTHLENHIKYLNERTIYYRIMNNDEYNQL